MRPLLVGEAPARTTVGARPFARGRSGERLRDLLGAPLEDVFVVRNLLDRWPGPEAKGSSWPRALARERAAALRRGRGQLLVLVGHRVAAAFGLDGPYLEERGGAVVFPHPSGVNRWWNEPANVEAARAFLAGLRRGEGRPLGRPSR